MADSYIQQGMFVVYKHLGESGVGKVQAGGDSPLVEFWSGKVERKEASDLEIVADSEPVFWLWDTPQELAPWAREKPLKLVALSLSIDRGRSKVNGKGSPNSIKEMLDGRVPLSADWKGWWGKRAKSLSALSALPKPEHFTRSAKGNVYTLLCDVAETPDDVSAPATLSDWKQWLLRDMKLPTFGKNPSEVLCDSLAEWPEDTIEQALKRVLWGAELLLGSPSKPSAAAALAWMDAVGSAVLRWRECALQSNAPEMEQRSGDILARLAQHIQVKEKRRESTLFRAGILSEAPDRERLLERQRQEQERQGADYENRLDRQRQEQERQRADYEARLERERREQERQQAAHAAELEGLRQSYEDSLERERREQERLRLQVRDFGAELAANRQESRLEIRQDMLLAVGEVLQMVARQQGSSIEELAGNVKAGLTLALRAGGADLLDTAPEGKVIAPGVIVRGGVHGDRVLLKTQVKHEAG